MAGSSRPRIALVAPRFTLFDDHMIPGFAARMRDRGDDAVRRLGPFFDVVFPGVIEDESDAARAGAVLASTRVDAIVVAPTMVAPPTFATIAIEQCPAPVVLWNPLQTARFREGLTQHEATEHSTTVGCTMVANALVRTGRPFAVVTTDPGDDTLDILRRTVAAAAAAGSLRGACFLRVGAPIPGYVDVESTEAELAAIGVHEHPVSSEELNETFLSVDNTRGDGVLDELRQLGWRGHPGPAATRSGRLAEALRELLDAHGAIGGTVNCHGPLLRFSDTVGVVACLGVSREALRGRMFSCTGDQPAAIALRLAHRVAGAALYNECYAPEPATGLMLVAAGGEGDPSWAAEPDDVSLEANDHYPGVHGEGASIAYSLRNGPATLLSLSPAEGGWRLAWATGEIVDSRSREMRGPNGMFKFDSGVAQEVTSNWISSGATHHNALAPGRLDIEIPVMSRMLGLRSIRV